MNYLNLELHSGTHNPSVRSKQSSLHKSSNFRSKILIDNLNIIKTYIKYSIIDIYIHI